MKTLPSNKVSSKDAIYLFTGQAGCQIGSALWTLFNEEHGIAPDGVAYSTNVIDNQSKYTHINFYKDSIYFHDDQFHRKFCYIQRENSENYVPKTLLVDLEPMVIDEIRTGSYRKFFHEGNFYQYTLKGDGSSIFARAYNYIGRLIIHKLFDKVRHLAENCDHLAIFNLARGYGGGTGCGIGSLLLEEIRDHYPKVIICENNIFNTKSNDAPTLEPYNCLFGLESSCMTSSISFLYSNNTIKNLVTNNLRIQRPTFIHMNNLISQSISGIYSTERFPGYGCCNVNSLLTNLIPYPRIQFPITSLAPIISSDLIRYENCSKPIEMIYDCFTDKGILFDINFKTGSFIANCMIYRGLVSPAHILEAHNSLIESKRMKFVDWNPSGIKVGHSPLTFVDVPNSKLGVNRLSMLMMTNHTNITNALSEISMASHIMLKKKAFMHWFFTNGVEEEDFSSALENSILLALDYKEIENSIELPLQLFTENAESREEELTKRTNNDLGLKHLLKTISSKDSLRRPLPDKAQLLLQNQTKNYLMNKRNQKEPRNSDLMTKQKDKNDSLDEIGDDSEFQMKYQARKLVEGHMKKIGIPVKSKEIIGKKGKPEWVYMDSNGNVIPFKDVKMIPGIIAETVIDENGQRVLKYFNKYTGEEIDPNLKPVISKDENGDNILLFCDSDGNLVIIDIIKPDNDLTEDSKDEFDKNRFNKNKKQLEAMNKLKAELFGDTPEKKLNHLKDILDDCLKSNMESGKICEVILEHFANNQDCLKQMLNDPNMLKIFLTQLNDKSVLDILKNPANEFSLNDITQIMAALQDILAQSKKQNEKPQAATRRSLTKNKGTDTTTTTTSSSKNKNRDVKFDDDHYRKSPCPKLRQDFYDRSTRSSKSSRSSRSELTRSMVIQEYEVPKEKIDMEAPHKRYEPKKDNSGHKEQSKDYSERKEQSKDYSERKEQNKDYSGRKEQSKDYSERKEQNKDYSERKEKNKDYSERKEQNKDNYQLKEQRKDKYGRYEEKKDIDERNKQTKKDKYARYEEKRENFERNRQARKDDYERDKKQKENYKRNEQTKRDIQRQNTYESDEGYIDDFGRRRRKCIDIQNDIRSQIRKEMYDIGSNTERCNLTLMYTWSQSYMRSINPSLKTCFLMDTQIDEKKATVKHVPNETKLPVETEVELFTPEIRKNYNTNNTTKSIF